MQQEPSCLVGPDPELRLKLQRRDTIGMRRDEVRSQEPCTQRQMGPMHNCPARRGSLPAAGRAFPGPRLGLKLPASASVARRADESARPPPTRQPLSASCVIRKHRHELLERRRPVMLPAAGLMRARHESRVTQRREGDD